jgi:hypothetical protein
MKIRLSGSHETVALWASFISQCVDCRISKEYDNRSGDVRVYIDVEDIEAEKLKQDDA